MNLFETFPTIDLTPLIKAIFTVLSLLITYKLVPWLKTKLSESKFNYLKAMTETLVFSAEQLYGAGEGAKKLDYVISKLHEKGLTFDPDVVEEYVYKLTHDPSSFITVTPAVYEVPASDSVVDDSDPPIIY